MVAIKHSENANPAQRRAIQPTSEKGNAGWQMIASPPLTSPSSVQATGSRTTRRGNDLRASIVSRRSSAAIVRSKLLHRDGRARVVKQLLLTQAKRGVVAVPSTAPVSPPSIAGPSAGPININDTSATATAAPLRLRKHRPARLSLIPAPNSAAEPTSINHSTPTQDVENAYINGSNSHPSFGMPGAQDIPMRDTSHSFAPHLQRPAPKTPPTLPKPEFRPIDTSVLAQINPDLENVPLDYIQKMIWREGATYVISYVSLTPH